MLPNDTFYVKRQVEVCKSDVNGSLRVDVAIFKNQEMVAVFECDGIQHFKNSFYVSDKLFEAAKKRDVDKQASLVEKNIPIVRIYQPDLWGGNGNPKKKVAIDFIKLMVSKIVDGTIEGNVHYHPGVALYDQK